MFINIIQNIKYKSNPMSCTSVPNPCKPMLLILRKSIKILCVIRKTILKALDAMRRKKKNRLGNCKRKIEDKPRK